MDKALLKQLVLEGLSQRQIANRIGTSQTNVRYWLLKHGIVTDRSKHKFHGHCKTCNKGLKRKHTVYCSLRCSGQDKTNQSHLKLMSGKQLHPQTIRQVLLRTRNHVCELCSTTRWGDQEVPLIVDHIDGNPYNNSIENLRLICPNCDALLSTYKGRNQGNGRHYRRGRYHAGLSY